jgi:son of sevenless-like protein
MPSAHLLLCTTTAKMVLSTNLMQCLDNTNQMTHCLATQVVTKTDVKMRALWIVRLIATGSELLAHGNLNGLMQVTSALLMSSVARLKRSWALVPPKALEMWEHLRKVTSARESFHGLRTLAEEHMAQGRPCVPHFGVWLTDLVYINESMSSTLDGKINMAKLKATSRILEMLVQCQAVLYNFQAVNDIQNLLLKTEILESEELYQLSLETEKKAE